MDSQVVEILGRNRLVDELLRAGLEVALPMRDRGIDLVAYSDLAPEIRRFSAIPIQMKACSSSAFSIDAKYAKFPNLIIAHIWNIDTPDHVITFATTFAESLSIAEAMGWTATESWAKGYYTNTRPGARLREFLEPFRMTPERWRQKVSGSAQAAD
jgi:hypothetical protein